ncbi:MAG: sugar ABC transporter permease [Lachnospiraceae bacterium]|nr:sugar ABC transporter permease [Lachnospiraceae bacterium]
MSHKEHENKVNGSKERLQKNAKLSYSEKVSPAERRSLWASRVIIWITMIVVIFPALWIVMSSFSAGDSFFLSSLFPSKLSVEHYVDLFRETNFVLWVWNSLKLCLIVAVIQLVLTSLAAYAFARLRFTGRKYGLMALLVLQVFPNSMAVAGYYILIYKFGLVDSSLALIFVLAGGSAFNIWLLKSYIDGIPVELDEAALVDGANQFQVFYKVILPLAMPQLAVLFLFSFIATYSEYVITSIFLQTPGKMTLSLGLQSFISDQFAAHWTMFSAAAVISSLPIMIVFMCLQRFIQNGLVAGGVKG